MTDFHDWIVQEFATRGAFSALVVLVEISELSVTPLSSTYLNVIGAEVDWREIVALFNGSGMNWDGASFFPVTMPGGGPLDNDSARAKLRELEYRVRNQRLSLNTGAFFNRLGWRLMVEEVPAR